jgi:hypothetical protein
LHCIHNVVSPPEHAMPRHERSRPVRQLRMRCTCCLGPKGQQGHGRLFMKPVVRTVKAAKNTKNRQKGVLYAKRRLMDAKLFKDMFVEEGGIVDALRAHYPRAKNVQIDNAEAHTGDNAIGKEEEANESGDLPRIEFKMQPAKSPDTNVCDIALWPLLKDKVDAERSRIVIFAGVVFIGIVAGVVCSLTSTFVDVTGTQCTVEF